METALMHHNAARYKAAVEAYLQALNTWTAMMAEEDGGGGGGAAAGGDASQAGEGEGGGKGSGKEGGGVQVADGLLLYFYVALGGVYER